MTGKEGSEERVVVLVVEKKKKRKFKFGTMDIILMLLGIALVIFIVDMRNIYVQTGGVPGELIAGVFAVAGGECGIMGWIQTSKNRKQERRYELEDRAYKEKNKEEE